MVLDAAHRDTIRTHANTLTTIMGRTCRFLNFHLTRLLEEDEEVTILDRSILDAIMVMVQAPEKGFHQPNHSNRKNWDEDRREQAEADYQGRLTQHGQLTESLRQVRETAPELLENPVALPPGCANLRQEVAQTYLSNLENHLSLRLPTLTHKVVTSLLRYRIHQYDNPERNTKPPGPKFR